MISIHLFCMYIHKFTVYIYKFPHQLHNFSLLTSSLLLFLTSISRPYQFFINFKLLLKVQRYIGSGFFLSCKTIGNKNRKCFSDEVFSVTGRMSLIDDCATKTMTFYLHKELYFIYLPLIYCDFTLGFIVSW